MTEAVYRRCILLRHARTRGNEERRYIGARTDEGLSPAGRREVLDRREALIRQVPSEAWLFSGPLRRTLETAEILFGDRPVRILEEMRETDFGDFEGKNYEELKDDPAYRAWIDSNGALPFPAGESREEMITRSMDGLYRALRLCPADKPLCILCHGGNIMGIMSRLTGRDFYDFQVGNLTGYDLEFDSDGQRIVDVSYHRLG